MTTVKPDDGTGASDDEVGTGTPRRMSHAEALKYIRTLPLTPVESSGNPHLPADLTRQRGLPKVKEPVAPQPVPRPDWDAVQSKRAAPLHDAVMLSLDCDPGLAFGEVCMKMVEYPQAVVMALALAQGVDLDYDPDGEPFYNHGPAEVSYRFHKSERYPDFDYKEAHRRLGMLELFDFELDYAHTEPDERGARRFEGGVVLTSFAAFALRQGWSLPERFPRPEPGQQVDRRSTVTELDALDPSEGLGLAIAAWREFWAPGRPQKKQLEIIEWVTERMKKARGQKTPSQQMVESIVRVIRPSGVKPGPINPKPKK